MRSWTLISISGNMWPKHDNNFILTGWIPEEDEENFRERLSKIDGIDYAVEDASEAVRHTPPTCLVNKKLFKPFEFFVDMFGLPNYHEIDPTPLWPSPMC